jgi:hypothetical protein
MIATGDEMPGCRCRQRDPGSRIVGVEAADGEKSQLVQWFPASGHLATLSLPRFLCRADANSPEFLGDYASLRLLAVRN